MYYVYKDEGQPLYWSEYPAGWVSVRWEATMFIDECRAAQVARGCGGRVLVFRS